MEGPSWSCPSFPPHSILFTFSFPPQSETSRRGGETVLRCSTVVFAIVGIMIAASVVVDCSNDYSQMRCRRTCVAGNCNRVEIRYGKYCGVGWSGCPGEKPCDDLGSCCQVHDECVEKKGMTNINAMENFKTCIKKVRKSGKVGFSRVCPYAQHGSGDGRGHLAQSVW